MVAEKGTILKGYRKRDRDKCVAKFVSKTEFEEPKDLYEILDVDPDATEKEIKKRFRYLAKLVHPDKCRDYDSKKAFQILKDAFDRMSENPSLESKPSWKTLYRENHLKDEEIRSLRNENSKLKAQTLFRRQQQRRAPVETKSTTPPVINRRRRKKRTPPRRGHTRSLFQDENIINGVCRNTGMVCKNCAAGRGCRWAGRGLPGHC